MKKPSRAQRAKEGFKLTNQKTILFFYFLSYCYDCTIVPVIVVVGIRIPIFMPNFFVEMINPLKCLSNSIKTAMLYDYTTQLAVWGFRVLF